jgi:hypothetical protein
MQVVGIVLLEAYLLLVVEVLDLLDHLVLEVVEIQQHLLQHLHILQEDHQMDQLEHLVQVEQNLLLKQRELLVVVDFILAEVEQEVLERRVQMAEVTPKQVMLEALEETLFLQTQLVVLQ